MKLTGLWKWIWLPLFIGVFVFDFLPPKRPTPKEQAWHQQALVLTHWDKWDVLGDKILALFGLSGNKEEWMLGGQYFDGLYGSKKLIDTANLKKWVQCIHQRKKDSRFFCREEEWAFSEDRKEWILVNRRFF